MNLSTSKHVRSDFGKLIVTNVENSFCGFVCLQNVVKGMTRSSCWFYVADLIYWNWPDLFGRWVRFIHFAQNLSIVSQWGQHLSIHGYTGRCSRHSHCAANWNVFEESLHANEAVALPHRGVAHWFYTNLTHMILDLRILSLAAWYCGTFALSFEPVSTDFWCFP